MSENDNESMKPLRELGNNYFKDNLFKEEEKIMKYGKQLAIGRKRNGSIYYLDMREAARIVILGKTRSGKSFLIRAIADRIKKIGYSIVYLTDVKNEAFSSKEPVQEKFRHLLLDNEKPEGMRIVTLRPTFFKQIDRGSIPKANRYYSVNLGAMTKADFMTLMNAESMTQPQQIILEIIFEKMAGKENFSLEDINAVIDEINELNAAQKLAMRFKFRPLATSYFYEKEHEKNIIDMIRNDIAVAINMENFDQFGQGGFLYPEVFVSMVMRMVINARVKKVIPPMLLILDESSRFVPVDKNPCCKRDVMEAVDIYGRYGISMVFGVQEITKIPIQIVKQARFLCIPYSADVGTIRDCLIMSSMVRNIQSSSNDAIYLKKSLKKYEWLILDTINNTKEIVKITCPLSNHVETGD